ncbi:hypothetical protein PENTCL1PPCAC_29324 [Pristionchus entomophagus]|uniref:PCNA-interacting partner n=1 Tax=Pristionchus entomophagus TaxID=358040 RepID=A0AAV5ULR7_9BILA|nr:hypothetical protein PENTCL1PPCAC_29324 [Pristionchus entomophagus]
MSDRGRLHFVNDLEMISFLWRHLSPKHETRTLTLIKHTEIIDRMEKAAGQHTSWRLSEDSLRPLFEELLANHEVRESIAASVSCLHFSVEEDQEAGWLVELIPLKIERGGPSTTKSFAASTPVLKEHLDLLLCLLSSTVDQSDPFSATRLLSSIAPSVLPGLRKRAASTKPPLNLVQALLSYSMTARIHEAGQEDEILSQSVDLLKRFDEAIDEMHEKMHEFEDCNRTISSMLIAATKFLMTTEKYQNDGTSIRKAQSLIQQQLKQLIANQKTMEAAVKCRNEEAPEFLTRRDRVARALLDRFTALDISGETAADIAMTPAFKTPQVAEVIVEKEIEETPIDLELTPTRMEEKREHKWFISSSTPTPKTDNKQPRSSSIYEELLDEEKENMGPFKKVLEIEDATTENAGKKEGPRTPLGEQTTPVRARPAGLRVRSSNENRPVFGEKKNEENKPKRRSKGAEGEAKKSKPLAPNQTSLTRFFGKA